MLDWQNVIRMAVREAGSSKWRDFALSRMPDIPGWTSDKPRGFSEATEVTYRGTTKTGVPLTVTLDKAKGVWRAEAGGLVIEDEVVNVDARSVKFALEEAAEAMDQHIQERRKTGARDFTSVDVRRLSGSLHDIRQRAADILEKLDDMVLDEGGRAAGLTDVRRTELDNGTEVGYNLDMIEQGTGAFRV